MGLEARYAARWVVCPGSVGLCARFDTTTNRAASEGATAHGVARLMLREGASPLAADSSEEMAYGGRLFATTVLEQCAKPDGIGDPDAYYYDVNQARLHIFCYHYGHRIIEARRNWPALCHAKRLIPTEHCSVWVHIIQPRAYHPLGPVRVWKEEATLLRGYFNTLDNAEEEALGDRPRHCPGPHCLYCDARHLCEPLRLDVSAIQDYSESPTPSEVLTPQALATELHVLDQAATLLEARRTGLKAQIVSQIELGRPVPGYTMEAGLGKAQWVPEEKELWSMGDLLGVDLRATVSPAEAKRRGLATEIIAGYTKRPSTTPGLKRTDKTLAHYVFGEEI